MSTDNLQPTDLPVGLFPASLRRKCGGCGLEDALLDEIGISHDSVTYVHALCGTLVELDKRTIAKEYIDP